MENIEEEILSLHRRVIDDEKVEGKRKQDEDAKRERINVINRRLLCIVHEHVRERDIVNCCDPHIDDIIAFIKKAAEMGHVRITYPLPITILRYIDDEYSGKSSIGEKCGKLLAEKGISSRFNIWCERMELTTNDRIKRFVLNVSWDR